MKDRTMAGIARHYDERRNEILTRIRNREVSASMSGIEYYPKPWAELDVGTDDGLYTVGVALTWDGTRHDAEVRRLTARELELGAQLMALYREEPGPDREAKALALRIAIACAGEAAPVIEALKARVAELEAEKAERLRRWGG